MSRSCMWLTQQSRLPGIATGVECREGRVRVCYLYDEDQGTPHLSPLPFRKGRGEEKAGDTTHVRIHFAGGPWTIATADAPMRKRSGSGFSTSMRTGNRCATRTQFSSRFTYGTPDGGRSISPSGLTAQPIPCTFPRKRWLGADER